MGTRADHTGVGNKLQPAVNPQGSYECDKIDLMSVNTENT